MKQEVLAWLQQWFRKKSRKVEGDLAKLASVDYLAAGYADSHGIVELIGELEKQFGIVFSIEGYEDPRFLTVGGLAEIVESLRTAQ